MVFLLYGTEEFIIKKHVNVLIKKLNVNKQSIMHLDLEQNSLGHILDKVNIFDLFSETNFVVASDISKYLIKETKIKELEVDRLIEFANQNSQHTLVLIANDSKIKNLKILKALGEKNIVKCNKLKPSEAKKLMFKAFENRKMRVGVHEVEYLFQKVGNNIRALISEIEKLSLLKRPITKELIDHLVIPKAENNIFLLIDAIISKDLEAAIDKYHDLVKSGTSPLAILSLVGNEISLMHNIALAKDWNIDNSLIAKNFKKPAFVVSKAAKRIKDYDIKQLKFLTDKIANLEKSFKSGKNNQNILIELFLIRLIKGKNNE